MSVVAGYLMRAEDQDLEAALADVSLARFGDPLEAKAWLNPAFYDQLKASTSTAM